MVRKYRGDKKNRIVKMCGAPLEGVLPKSKTNENDPIGERTGARIGASLQVWTLLRLRTAALRHLGNTPLKLFLVGMGALRRPRRRAKRLATEQIGLDAPP